MARRHVTPAIVLTLLLGACSAAPADPAPTDPVDAVPGSAVEQARSVVGDLEERSRFIDSQMRDPFSPP